jgi:hypothetical protein
MGVIVLNWLVLGLALQSAKVDGDILGAITREYDRCLDGLGVDHAS